MIEPNASAAKFDRDFVRTEAEKLKAKAQRRKIERPSFASVDHLNPEAVAAYVDNELSEQAAHRARIHMVHCEECRTEVASQHRASQRIKQCCNDNMHAPRSLMERLAQIESECTSDSDGTATPESLLKKLESMAKSLKRTDK